MDLSHPAHYKGVKELVDSGVSKLPSIYIRPQHERPSNSKSTSNFPVIDLSSANAAKQIGHACKTLGFFQVINHGVPHTTMDNMLSVAHEFHNLPNEEKMRYFSTDIRSRMRYATSFNVVKDKVLNWRDFLRHDCLPLSEMTELWPDKPASYRQITAEYSTCVRNLGTHLLDAISESLGLSRDYISKAFGGHSQVMALNYYPACIEPDLVLGLAPHTDPGSTTVLMQDHDVTGLQVRHNGAWYTVEPVKHAFAVNIADQLQILSNDKYKSAEHRAIVNYKQARMSIPTALGPSWDSLVKPAPELIDEDNTPAFKPVRYQDYMLSLQGRTLEKPVLDSYRI